MYDGDELCSEPGLYIAGDMFNSGDDRVVSRERGIHDDAKAFHMEVSLVQGFKGASIIEVVIKGDSEVRVRDGGD